MHSTNSNSGHNFSVKDAYEFNKVTAFGMKDFLQMFLAAVAFS